MVINNIQKARILFPDAVKLQLRINQSTTTINDIRRLLPSSVILLSCKISRNYASVIYSEGAAKKLFPDAGKLVKELSLVEGKKAYIYAGENHETKVLVNFYPTSYAKMMNALELAFGPRLVQVSKYIEANMGCLFFREAPAEDVIRVLMMI